jgi:flagellar hook-basal body complex protein FliE
MAIGNVSGVRADITEMLQKIREVSNKSKVFSQDSVAPTGTKSFDNVLSLAKNAISNVNNTQIENEKIKTAYITGEKNVSLSQVIVSSQKSKLAFEGLITVRNKLLDAYKEIMNMPV